VDARTKQAHERPSDSTHRWHIVLAAFSVGDPAVTNDEFDYIAVKPALLKGLP